MAPVDRDHPLDVADPSTGWSDVWLVGLVHEHAASAEDRKARGAWYTPRSVVDGLLRLATEDGQPPAFIADPTCGGGAFLLAALDRLVALGVAPAEAVGRVGGLDLDPLAVAVSRWSITLWLGRQRQGGFGPDGLADSSISVRLGDALVDDLTDWPRPLLLVGNPPFASPLKRGAVPEQAARYRAERVDVLGPYANLASIHLLRSVEVAGRDSMVVQVQPQSVLAGRDSEALRSHLAERSRLEALWAAREPVFDAAVRACAPLLVVGAGTGEAAGSGPADAAVRLASGPDVVELGRRPHDRWGPLGADALGAPRLPTLGDRSGSPAADRRLVPRPTQSVSPGLLGELVQATAGFRDEHYGLVSVCREATATEHNGDGTDTARLVTVGSVDPLTVSWGRSPIRFGGQDWSRPIVDRGGLSPRVSRWFDRQLRPKVLLATQTKLLEPVVDRAGDLMPSTPLLALHGDAGDLDAVAAVMLAPPIVVWAWRETFGSAMAVDAVKLAARQIADVPLPIDSTAWSEATELIATLGSGGLADSPAAAWDTASEVAAIMTEAYNASDEVLNWWLDRRKPRPDET